MPSTVVVHAGQWGNGQKIEVQWRRDWWHATVIAVEGGRVLVDYEGGTQSDQEWIDANSRRLRSGSDSGSDEDEVSEGDDCGSDEDAGTGTDMARKILQVHV